MNDTATKAHERLVYDPSLECRVILLERDFERIEKKVDKLDAKLDAKVDTLSREIAIVRVDIANARTEMHGMIWRIPAILAVIMTIVGGAFKLLHWI